MEAKLLQILRFIRTLKALCDIKRALIIPIEFFRHVIVPFCVQINFLSALVTHVNAVYVLEHQRRPNTISASNIRIMNKL